MRFWGAVLLLGALACDASRDAPRGAQPLPPDIARDVQRTVDEMMASPPEAIPAAVTAQAVDPAKLLGTWAIVHMISKKNGVAGDPTPPLVDGTWSFAKDGGYQKRGGTELEGTYVLTSGKLMISALGPVLEYTVDTLTPTELVVTFSNPVGTLLFETTTVLRRAPARGFPPESGR